MSFTCLSAFDLLNFDINFSTARHNEATASLKFGAHYCSARILLKSDQKLCINTNYSLKKLNRYSFPICFLKMKKKNIVFPFFSCF